MILTLFSWIAIFIFSVIWGYIINRILYKNLISDNKDLFFSIDTYVVCGLIFLTLFSEIFSIIYKVGILALAILLLFTLFAVLILYAKDRNKNWVSHISKIKELPTFKWVLISFSVLIFLVWTCGAIEHPDTSLYHIQAIKWIEKYGVVPGLGNLHNRFAYNSAFMCLQALFSFSWILGSSGLHSVNGFVCLLFFLYAVLSFDYGKDKLLLSDFIRISIIIFIGLSTEYISSPGTDLFPMLCILYLCAKWCSVTESDNYQKTSLSNVEYRYAFLCMIAVFAMTIKLSVAVFALLSIYPIIVFVKKKNIMAIIAHVFFAFIIVLPWILRNIIISGYLIYPYPQIDLFNVDWKMPASVAIYDSMEITVWGRTTRDVTSVHDGFSSWIDSWFFYNSNIIVWLSFISIIFVTVYFINEKFANKFSHKRYILPKETPARSVLFPEFILFCISVSEIIFWFLSAPLYRYGLAFLLIPICYMGYIFYSILCNIHFAKHVLEATITFLVAIMVICCGHLFSQLLLIKDVDPIYETEYAWYASEHIDIGNDIQVWYPSDSQYSSNDVFPEAAYYGMLEKIEPRGTEISKGFRMKDEYRNANRLTEYGTEWPEGDY